jgi:putative radical SAM enzyme (TIGR03279 family)
MMRNKHAGEVLSYMRRLADAGIRICAQVVLCRGINDGEELDRTMRDMLTYMPALDSVSIVPAGLTRYRQKLYPLEPYTPEECRAIIEQVTCVGDACVKEYGRRVFFCADELYIKGGVELPCDDYYENYSQLEDGIGMVTSQAFEFEAEMSFLEDDLEAYTAPRTVTVATGVAAFDSIRRLCERLEASVEGLTIRVVPIINHFFGETITVAGLLTGHDMAEQLAGRELGDEVLVPEHTLRADGDLFLCGMTPVELSEHLGKPVRISPNDGGAFLTALLGTNQDTPIYDATRRSEEEVDTHE